MDAEDPPPAAPLTPLPAAISLGLLVLLLGGGVALALAFPRGPDEATARRAVQTTGIGRDPLTGLVLDAAGNVPAPASGFGSEAEPIRIRFVPAADTGAEGLLHQSVEHLVAFLRARTGLHLEARTVHSYSLLVEELAAGKAEVGFLTATSYARARHATENNDRPEDDLEAILVAVRAATAEHPRSDLAYRAALIVRTESDLQSVEDVRGRKVALGNRISGAGSILPSALFNRLGIEPRITRYKGYPSIVHAVLQGAVDVGSVFWSPPNDAHPQNDARFLVETEVPDVFARTRILAFTDWIPNAPVVVRRVVPERLRHRLARAISLYVTQQTLTPEGRRRLDPLGGVVGYLPATNDDFQPLMETIENAFANDAEGYALFRAGRR